MSDLKHVLFLPALRYDFRPWWHPVRFLRESLLDFQSAIVDRWLHDLNVYYRHVERWWITRETLSVDDACQVRDNLDTIISLMRFLWREEDRPGRPVGTILPAGFALNHRGETVYLREETFVPRPPVPLCSFLRAMTLENRAREMRARIHEWINTRLAEESQE